MTRMRRCITCCCPPPGEHQVVVRRLNLFGEGRLKITGSLINRSVVPVLAVRPISVSLPAALPLTSSARCAGTTTHAPTARAFCCVVLALCARAPCAPPRPFRHCGCHVRHISTATASLLGLCTCSRGVGCVHPRCRAAWRAYLCGHARVQGVSN